MKAVPEVNNGEILQKQFIISFLGTTMTSYQAAAYVVLHICDQLWFGLESYPGLISGPIPVAKAYTGPR